MDQQLGQLKTLIDPWLPAYKQIHIAGVGVIHDGKRWLLAAKIEIAPSGLKPFLVKPLDGPIFWTANTVTPFSPDTWKTLLDNAALGKVKIGSVEASCDFDQTHPPRASFYAGHHPAIES